MSESHEVATQLTAALDNIDQLRPAEELAVYEQVLTQLTDLLNAPDERAPGDI